MSKMAPCRHVRVWDSTKWWPLVGTSSIFSRLFFLSALSVTHIDTVYTHSLVWAHKKHTRIPRLWCASGLLIMRFLQDGKLQGDWLTAHFKHYSLPLPFSVLWDRGWNGNGKETKKNILCHTLTWHSPLENSKRDAGPCGFAGKNEQALGVLQNIVLSRKILKMIFNSLDKALGQ